jgi:hypothetical protein
MANSLTDWLSSKVSSSIQSSEGGPKGPTSRTALLDDIEFLKGRKVQIVRFYTSQAALVAAKEVQAPLRSEAAPESIDNEGEALWAVVADKVSSVTLRFSPFCVENFNR